VRIKASISSERSSRLVICGLDGRDWRAFSPIFSLGVAIAIAPNICSTIFAIELEREGGFRRDPARGTNGISFLELGMINGVCMVWRKLLSAACCVVIVASSVLWDVPMVVPSF
jgi:hypothetical protein